VCAMAVPAGASAVELEGEDLIWKRRGGFVPRNCDGNGVCRGVVDSMFFEDVVLSFRRSRARDRWRNTTCSRSSVEKFIPFSQYSNTGSNTRQPITSVGHFSCEF
jgi:hypothetical protein